AALHRNIAEDPRISAQLDEGRVRADDQVVEPGIGGALHRKQAVDGDRGGTEMGTRITLDRELAAGADRGQGVLDLKLAAERGRLERRAGAAEYQGRGIDLGDELAGAELDDRARADVVGAAAQNAGVEVGEKVRLDEDVVAVADLDRARIG